MPRKDDFTSKCGEGRDGQRETLSCGVAPRKASADPPGSSGAAMAPRTGPKLGMGARPPRGPWTRRFSSRHFPMRTDSEGSVLAALSAAGGLSPSALERGVWRAEHSTHHRGLPTGASTWARGRRTRAQLCVHGVHVALRRMPGRGVSEAFLQTLQDLQACQTQGCVCSPSALPAEEPSGAESRRSRRRFLPPLSQMILPKSGHPKGFPAHLGQMPSSWPWPSRSFEVWPCLPFLPSLMSIPPCIPKLKGTAAWENFLQLQKYFMPVPRTTEATSHVRFSWAEMG